MKTNAPAPFVSLQLAIPHIISTRGRPRTVAWGRRGKQTGLKKKQGSYLQQRDYLLQAEDGYNGELLQSTNKVVLPPSFEAAGPHACWSDWSRRGLTKERYPMEC